MQMIEIPTTDLSGPALDWAVAVAEGLCVSIVGRRPVVMGEWSPSSNWCQGGPLLERYIQMVGQKPHHGHNVAALHKDELNSGFGATILIAACRAIVTASLGKTVRVPAPLIAL